MKGGEVKQSKKAAAIPAKAAGPPPSPPGEEGALPSLPGCELTLDWRDFKGLLEARSERAEAPPERTPVAYVLGCVRAEGAVAERAASLRVEVPLQVLAEGWCWVPLIGGEAALRSLTLDGGPAALLERQGQRGLLVEGPLAGTLRCELVLPLLVEAAQSGLELGFPAAPALELELSVPTEQDLDLRVEPAVRRDVRREGKRARLSASVPAPRQVRVRWTVAEREDQPAAEAPLLQARVETLAQVGEGSLRLRAQLRVEVLRAPARELSLLAPRGFSVTDLRAPRLAQWDVEATPAGERLTLWLEQAVEGALVIELDCDRPLDEGGRAPLSLPRLLGAVRDQGHLGLVALTNVDVSIEDLSGARRIDGRELPERLSARAARAVLHAFHYAGTEPALVVQATKHPELPVITTVVDRAAFLVMVTEDGQRYVQGRYTVRNAQQQFLRVTLGPQEELLSALREGDPVKPAQADERCVLVPLRRARTPAEADEPFTVEVVTRVPQPAFAERGALALSLPTVSLPIAYLTCELHVPKGYVYDDFAGSLHEVEGFEDPIVSRAALLARLAPPRSGAQRPSIQAQAPPPRLRASRAPAPQQQLDASFSMVQQAANAPLAEAPAEVTDLFAEQAAGDPFGASPSPVELGLLEPGESGRLPIRIEIPEQGERFRFERILCLGEPLEVRTEYAQEKR